jgi:hypothetical protein
MSLNLERAAMRGQLAEAADQRRSLRLKADGLCDSIRAGLNTALADVEEINTALVAQQMDELVMTMGELAGLQGKISRLERELR